MQISFTELSFDKIFYSCVLITKTPDEESIFVLMKSLKKSNTFYRSFLESCKKKTDYVNEMLNLFNLSTGNYKQYLFVEFNFYRYIC